jgi:hypothetical protein
VVGQLGFALLEAVFLALNKAPVSDGRKVWSKRRAPKKRENQRKKKRKQTNKELLLAQTAVRLRPSRIQNDCV